MNTWIFQGNPTKFNVDAYLLENDVITWSMRQKHLVKHIEIGDTVFIWRSDGDAKGSGGIVAKAQVMSLPQDYINSEESAQYWYEDVTEAYLAVHLKVLEVNVEYLLKRTDLLQHEFLQHLPILKIKNNTNYLLTPELGTALVKEWEELTGTKEDYIHDFEQEMDELKVTSIEETEKEQLIKARIGQSSFKKALLAAEKKCKLCGVSDEAFLIASHIKPWSVSNHQERLDVNNGLLLCPNHDRLFDKGFISFLDNGQIIISERLDDNAKLFMNVQATMRIKITDQQIAYMQWHIENIFKQ